MPRTWAEFFRLIGEAAPALGGAVPDLGRLVLLWAGMTAAGRVILRRFVPEGVGGWDGLVYAGGLGVWVVSMGMLGLGLAGVWKTELLRYGFYGGGVLGVGFWIKEKITERKISGTE